MRHGTHGIALKMSDMAGSPVFATIAQITGLTPPAGSRGVTPIAEHDMAGAIEKLADALRDEGQLTLAVNFDPAGATHDETTGFESVYRSGVLTDFQLVFPDAGSKQADFSAIVVNRSYGEYGANTGVGGANLTLDISGAITWS